MNGVAGFLTDGLSQRCLDREPVRAVALGHQRAGEWLTVDLAADLHKPAGTEELVHVIHHDARPRARVVALLKLGVEAVIAFDPPASRKLYVDVLGLPLGGGEYLHSERIAGCKSFGVWPLSQVAEACFGTPRWPAERPVPQVSIEFDVADAAAVGPAARELQQAGHDLLHALRQEPWGQTVARLQSPEGAIIGISHIPCFTTKADLGSDLLY